MSRWDVRKEKWWGLEKSSQHRLHMKALNFKNFKILYKLKRALGFAGSFDLIYGQFDMIYGLTTLQIIWGQILWVLRSPYFSLLFAPPKTQCPSELFQHIKLPEYRNICGDEALVGEQRTPRISSPLSHLYLSPLLTFQIWKISGDGRFTISINSQPPYSQADS